MVPAVEKGASGSKIWTVRGIPAELQAAVSTAAKSARQTLGEWTASALRTALETGPLDGGRGRGDGELPPALTSRFEVLEIRNQLLERRLDSLEGRSEGTQFRVDGLENRSEGQDLQQTATVQRLAAFEDRLRVLEARLAPVTERPPPADELFSAEDPAGAQGPFTRGFGSRKRLTSGGEEELQRLLAAGVDDATIAARLGIHKRIVWARRLTVSGSD